jgi:hypothetical protein
MIELDQGTIAFLNIAAAICEKYGESASNYHAKDLDSAITRPATEIPFDDLGSELGCLSAKDLCEKVAEALRGIASGPETVDSYGGPIDADYKLY